MTRRLVLVLLLVSACPPAWWRPPPPTSRRRWASRSGCRCPPSRSAPAPVPAGRLRAEGRRQRRAALERADPGRHPALKTGPTINARALAVVHTAMYDAWAAYDATAVGTRLGGSPRRPPAERTDAYKSQAVSYAAYRPAQPVPGPLGRLPGPAPGHGLRPRRRHHRPGLAHRGRQPGRRRRARLRATDGSNQANGYADTIGYVPVNTPDQVNDLFRWQAAAPPQRQRRHHGPEVPDPALGLHHPVRDDLARPVPPAGTDPADAAAAGRGGHRHPAGQRHPHRPDQDQGRVLGRRPRQRDPAGHWLLFAGAVCRARGYDLDQSACRPSPWPTPSRRHRRLELKLRWTTCGRSPPSAPA